MVTSLQHVAFDRQNTSALILAVPFPEPETHNAEEKQDPETHNFQSHTIGGTRSGIGSGAGANTSGGLPWRLRHCSCPNS